MSDQEQEQTPPAGDDAPPQVEPISPPEPASEPPEPVGRTREAEQGLPATDESQGVGVAPTQDGDSEDGESGTAFRPSSDFEDGDGDEHDGEGES